MSTTPRSPQDPQSCPLPAVWLDLVVDSAAGGDADREGLTRRAEQLLETSFGRRPTDVEWSALHAARGHVRGLGALGRRAVPQALEGLVVASLEAGHRQDRATSVLGSLERKDAPAQLDVLVESTVDRAAREPRAPAVLDRLVEERISQPQVGTVRSMAARLGRKSAPRALDRRVLDGEPVAVGAANVRRTTGRLVAAGMTVLALIISVQIVNEGGADTVAVGSQVSTGSQFSMGADGPQISIVRIELSDLSSADRMFCSFLTGQPFGGGS